MTPGERQIGVLKNENAMGLPSPGRWRLINERQRQRAGASERQVGEFGRASAIRAAEANFP